jgi:TonB-linked SusC/RagA family outer membrane protein
VVTGTVVDENGEPLPGVTVVVKGTTQGSATDINGRYAINVPEGGILIFRGVGLTTQEIVVGSQTIINPTMQSDTRQLGEVVVVGYGTQNRAELTSSVSKVTSETLQDLPVAGIDQALQGRAAGVQITTNSGTPGGGVTVRVRGSSSISASNQPLYVIDGVPLTTGDFSQLGFGGQSINALTDINPNDIESIEVLKDASAAAIYGSRAANGVVLITTKRGKTGKTQFNFNTYAGFQEAWRRPKFLDRTQYLEVATEALVNDGFLPAGSTGDDFIDFFYGGLPFENTVNTNWLDEVLRTASIQNYELSSSGGNDKTKYYLSANYFDQQGLVINSRYQRLSTRLNLDHNVNNRFTIGTSVQLSRAVNNRIVSDNTLNGPFANALAASPLWPVRDAQGRYTRPQFFYSNPVAEGTENDDINVSLRAVANAYAKYALTDNLNINGRVGIDQLSFSERRYTPDNYPGSSSTQEGGSGQNNYSNVLKWLTEATIDYRVPLAEQHNLTLLAGFNQEYNIINQASVRGIGFPGERFRFVSAAATVNQGSNFETYWGLTSFFGRANYALYGKYLLSVNFRADASSRFGVNNRWGYFPALSAGWRISEEEFFGGLKNTISDLKVRASWGITGNQEIGNFASRNFYGGANYFNAAGIAPTQIGDPNLKWEETTQTDIGLDIGFFNNRVTLSADYYVKTTKDLLFSRPIATQNGFGSFFTNIGSVENRGFEFTLTTVNVQGGRDEFSWTSDLNMSFNRNKVLELFEGQDVFYGFGGNSLVLREGQPIGTFYGFIADGVYARTEDVPQSLQALGIQGGDMNYRDINGDGIINDADLTIIGSAQPLFVGGFNNTFRYKGFDLNIFMQFSYGNDIWNAAGSFQQGLFANFFDDNQVDAVLNRWRQEGDITAVPRATTDVSVNQNNRSNTTRFIRDGSFLRFKNVIFGYTLPKRLIDRVSLRSARVYVQAQNLFTFTNYPGFDPEVNFAGTSNTTLGVDFYTFPQPRTITFGLNIGF